MCQIIIFLFFHDLFGSNCVAVLGSVNRAAGPAFLGDSSPVSSVGDGFVMAVPPCQISKRLYGESKPCDYLRTAPHHTNK